MLTLTFHGIGPSKRPLEPGEDQVWLTLDHFRRVLDAVVAEADVEITFDDSNASDVEHAMPALRERGLRATFFVLAGRLGSPGALGVGDCRELLANDMAIGSHGMDHRPWRALDAALTRTEIVDAKLSIERSIGRPVTKAACPFGAYDRHALRSLRRAGFETVYTSDGGPGRAGQWLRARNTVGPSDDPSAIRGLLRSPAVAPANVLRACKKLVKRFR